MRTIIVHDKDINGAWNELVECRRRGDFAMMEFGGFVNTTDDVPKNFEHMRIDKIYEELKLAGMNRQMKLEVAKRGISGPNAEMKLFRETIEEERANHTI